MQIWTCDAGEAQDGHHEYDECGGDDAGGDGEASEIPRAGTETVADKEDADENRSREGTGCVSIAIIENRSSGNLHKGSNGSNTE